MGSGLFYDGKLIPNVELGRIYHTDGEIIEKICCRFCQKKRKFIFRRMGEKI